MVLMDIGGCLLVLGITGYIDYATGYERSFFLFYLIPILLTLRRLGPGLAMGMCVLSALVWFGSNLLAGARYDDWFTPSWNTLLRCLVFLLVTQLLALRGRLEKQVRQSSKALSHEVQTRMRLEQEVLEASEREQRRIGHDLHDSLCQHLAATALAGKVLARKLGSRSIPEAEAASRLVAMIEQGIEQARTLARSLHPIELGSEGLVGGLRVLAQTIRDGFSVGCTFECTREVALATAEANMHLYRIAQEAISNAIRHGQARNITVQLDAYGGEVVLSVTDDGAGLPAAALAKGGMGLRIMNYRAGMIGGRLEVQRLPARGTRVTCTVPATSPATSETHAEQK
jgi:signal transduction histidine kinase